MFKTAYIDSIREYVPEAAKVLLDEQVQKVRQQIADDVATFGKALREHLEQEVATLVASAQVEAQADAKRIADMIDALKGPAQLQKAKEALKTALDDFITKWSGLGEKVGAAVKTAAAKALAL